MITKDNLQSYYKQGVPYTMLSRKFEDDLPSFNSHKEVRLFFKDLFGDNFMLKSTDNINGDKIYFYTIIHDRKTWESGLKELDRNGFVSGTEFMMSTQDIQVFADGSTHMVF